MTLINLICLLNILSLFYMTIPIILVILLSVLGLLNTGYLIRCKLTKKPVLCLFFPDEWCAKVQTSKYAKTFGIPNAYLGFIMYLALLISTILFSKAIISSFIIKLIISFGFAFSLYFLILQAFIIRAFCTWCVLSAVEFCILFGLMFFI